MLVGGGKVAVGGTGVLVGGGTVAVGGIGVSVGGAAVLVGGATVWVGGGVGDGAGVLLGPGVWVAGLLPVVAVAVGVGVAELVAVAVPDAGGMDVCVAVLPGVGVVDMAVAVMVVDGELVGPGVGLDVGTGVAELFTVGGIVAVLVGSMVVPLSGAGLASPGDSRLMTGATTITSCSAEPTAASRSAGSAGAKFRSRQMPS